MNCHDKCCGSFWTMILILSEPDDDSTSNVIDWLLHYKANFIRINEGEVTTYKICLNGHFVLNIARGDQSLDLTKIKAFWYRRGNFSTVKHFSGNERIDRFINREQASLEELIHMTLKKKPSIGSYLENYINKIHVMRIASNKGLRIPHTLITSKRASLQEFLKKYDYLITKPIKDGFWVDVDNKRFSFPTTLITSEDLGKYPIDFNTLLVQEYIDKLYELRIFYLDGEFCSTAVFPSRENPQARIDIRADFEGVPNRIVPYNLPDVIKVRLDSMMKELNYLSGSIDMVVSKTLDYYFLEVNPIGQYQQVSNPGNYGIDKMIARKLIQLDHEN